MSTDEPGRSSWRGAGRRCCSGYGEEELFVGVGRLRVLEHTRSVVYLDDGDILLSRGAPPTVHVSIPSRTVQLREVDGIGGNLAR